MDEVSLSLSGTEDFIVAKIANFGDGDEGEIPQKGVFTGSQLCDQKVVSITEICNNGRIAV